MKRREFLGTVAAGMAVAGLPAQEAKATPSYSREENSAMARAYFSIRPLMVDAVKRPLPEEDVQQSVQRGFAASLRKQGFHEMADNLSIEVYRGQGKKVPEGVDYLGVPNVERGRSMPIGAVWLMAETRNQSGQRFRIIDCFEKWQPRQNPKM